MTVSKQRRGEKEEEEKGRGGKEEEEERENLIPKATIVSFYPHSRCLKHIETVDPADPFTTLELQNPRHDVSELHKNCRSPDLEALKL